MVQEHERALGGWQAEWDTLPEIIQLTSGALHQLCDVVEGLTVHVERMRSNIDITHGLVMAESVSIALSNPHVLKQSLPINHCLTSCRLIRTLIA
jgi:3-carboxy-cis,cis-muconate cycloisomerase